MPAPIPQRTIQDNDTELMAIIVAESDTHYYAVGWFDSTNFDGVGFIKKLVDQNGADIIIPKVVVADGPRFTMLTFSPTALSGLLQVEFNNGGLAKRAFVIEEDDEFYHCIGWFNASDILIKTVAKKALPASGCNVSISKVATQTIGSNFTLIND